MTGDLSVSPNCRARSHYERVHRDTDQVPNPLRRRTSPPKYEPIEAIKEGPGGVDGFELPGVTFVCPESETFSEAFDFVDSSRMLWVIRE